MTHTVAGHVPNHPRVRYDKGDLEIQIEPWLQRDVSGGDERRTFRTWERTSADEEAGIAADPGPVTGTVYTINSTELRAAGFAMRPQQQVIAPHYNLKELPGSPAVARGLGWWQQQPHLK